MTSNGTLSKTIGITTITGYNKKMHQILVSSSLRLPLPKTGNFKRYLLV